MNNPIDAYGVLPASSIFLYDCSPTRFRGMRIRGAVSPRPKCTSTLNDVPSQKDTVKYCSSIYFLCIILQLQCASSALTKASGRIF
jgi:hypothetical protein